MLLRNTAFEHRKLNIILSKLNHGLEMNVNTNNSMIYKYTSCSVKDTDLHYCRKAKPKIAIIMCILH